MISWSSLYKISQAFGGLRRVWGWDDGECGSREEGVGKEKEGMGTKVYWQQGWEQGAMVRAGEWSKLVKVGKGMGL